MAIRRPSYHDAGHRANLSWLLGEAAEMIWKDASAWKTSVVVAGPGLRKRRSDHMPDIPNHCLFFYITRHTESWNQSELEGNKVPLWFLYSLNTRTSFLIYSKVCSESFFMARTRWAIQLRRTLFASSKGYFTPPLKFHHSSQSRDPSGFISIYQRAKSYMGFCLAKRADWGSRAMQCFSNFDTTCGTMSYSCASKKSIVTSCHGNSEMRLLNPASRNW